MRACLVLGRVEVFGVEGADRERGLDLLLIRAAERVEALDLDFDLDFVMGSSEVMRRHPPHHLSPARAKPGRARPRSAHSPLQSHHSNAPIKPVSQSNPSNIIALLTATMAYELLSRRGGRLLLGRNQRAERLALSGDISRSRFSRNNTRSACIRIVDVSFDERQRAKEIAAEAEVARLAAEQGAKGAAEERELWEQLAAEAEASTLLQ
jgi:hypothetical protein